MEIIQPFVSDLQRKSLKGLEGLSYTGKIHLTKSSREGTHDSVARDLMYTGFRELSLIISIKSITGCSVDHDNCQSLCKVHKMNAKYQSPAISFISKNTEQISILDQCRH
jgi:hypothetical protein